MSERRRRQWTLLSPTWELVRRASVLVLASLSDPDALNLLALAVAPFIVLVLGG